MRKVGSWIVLILALLWVLALVCLQLHAEPAMPRPNSLGVEQTYTNTNTYLLAVPLEANFLQGKYVSIRFAPYNTTALYDETVLFCGTDLSEFEGKNGVVVVTYETRAHVMYKGIGCHRLVSVFEVK